MNSRQRWKIKRAQKHAAANAGQGSDAGLERVVSACLMGVSGSVAKALTLIDGPAAPRQIQEDCGATKQERRNRSIFYKDTNPFGNKIHAVQKARGKSMPLI